MFTQISTPTLGIGFAPAWHRPFLRYVEGEQGGGGESVDSAEAETTDDTGGEQASDAQESAAETSTDESAAESGETFSRAYVEKLRRENATAREKAKTDAAAAAEAAKTELAQSIGKALGLIKDDETADPEAILAQAQADRQSAIEEARSTKVELAVLKAADKHGADTDVLLNWNPFLARAKNLDPAADDFADQVDALIKAQVESNPARFKRAQMAASAGGSTHTGETAPGPKTIEDRRKAIQDRRSR